MAKRPTVRYGDVRRLLRRLGFEHVRTGKHEVWRRRDDDGQMLRVLLSKQRGKAVPKGLLHQIARQAGVTAKVFFSLLRR